MLCVLASMLAGMFEEGPALKPNFAHPVLQALERRAMTEIEGLSDFHTERCLRPSSRRTQILYPAMPIKWTFTAGRRALHVKAHPICSIPHTSPPCRLSAGLCRTAAGLNQMKNQKSTVANPSPALGSDALQFWVVLSPSCQGRLLWIHDSSWSCWSRIV